LLKAETCNIFGSASKYNLCLTDIFIGLSQKISVEVWV